MDFRMLPIFDDTFDMLLDLHAYDKDKCLF